MFEFSNPGSRMRPVRKAMLENGQLVVKQVGEEDQQALINSYADSCDINILIARAMNGEPEILNARQGYFGDFTQFPKTYAEALDKVIQATDLFESLPLETRNKFDNNVYRFISEMDEPDWIYKAGFAQMKESEVKESES